MHMYMYNHVSWGRDKKPIGFTISNLKPLKKCLGHRSLHLSPLVLNKNLEPIPLEEPKEVL